jgi:methylmalonyl-CoA carboxyltransferase small subunit
LKLQITVEGKTYEVEVEVLEEDEGVRPPSSGSYQPIGGMLQSMAPSVPPEPGVWGNGDTERVCRSPITGLVIKVNVEPGQTVAPNDLLMVLEAMKMETNVTAPGPGRIKSVKAVAGDSVKLHQVLIEFE